MSVRTIPWKAYAALLVVYLVWGTTIGSIRIGVESFPWLLLPCLRFLIGGILLTSFGMLRGERLPERAEIRRHILTGCLLFVGGNTVVCWAVGHIATGMGGLMVATTPFWMIGLSALLPPRERVSGPVLLGVLIGFAGMLLLLYPRLSHLQTTPPSFWWGMAAMLANTVFWALGSVYVRKRPAAKASLPMGVGLQNLSAGLALLPVCMLTTPHLERIHPTPASLGALLYLIFFGTILAAPCYIYMLRRLPVSISSTFAYVTPVITVLFGSLVLNEPLTSLTVVGMSIILSGVILVQYLGQKTSLAAPVMKATEPETEAMCGAGAVPPVAVSYTETAAISVASRR